MSLETKTKNNYFSNIKYDVDNVSFDLTNVDTSLANSFRRTVLSEIPTYGFEDESDKTFSHYLDIGLKLPESVKVLENTSSLHNEFLSHRVGLIPVCSTRPVTTSFNETLMQRIFHPYVDNDKVKEGTYEILKQNAKCFGYDINKEKINNVGNIMIDTLTKNLDLITSKDNFSPQEFSIERKYFVLTLHRPINLTDKNLEIIFGGISEFTNDYDILIPAHPRLKEYVNENKIDTSKFKVIDPQPYLKFLGLVHNSELCLTDSGGLQEETTYLNKKCLTLREETERPITVSKGTNKVIGVNKNIINEINNALNTKIASYKEIDLWDGNTSERIFKDFDGK